MKPPQGSMTVIERGFQPFARWRLRLVVSFYAWVGAVVIPATFLFHGAVAGDTRSEDLGLISAAVPLALFAPFVVFWTARRPTERYQVDRYLAQRERAHGEAWSGRRARSHTFLEQMRSVNPLSWLVSLVAFVVSLLLESPTTGVVALMVGAVWLTVQWRDAAERTTIAVIAEVDNVFPRTHLRIAPHYRLGPRRARMQLVVTGRFRGRNIELASDLATLGGEIVVVVELGARQAFELRERDPRWNTWTGENHHACFDQRFELTGVTSSSLPAAFIETTVEYDRNLHLDVSGGEMVFRCRSGKVMPFYSVEGVVLLLDWLTGIARHLDAGRGGPPLHTKRVT